MPWHSSWVKPLGQMSSSMATKSVSDAEEAAKSYTTTGPVTSSGSSSGGVVNTSTSGRPSRAR